MSWFLHLNPRPKLKCYVLSHMKNKSSQIHKLRSNDDAAFANTAQVQQALAQLEANLSREENQKVTEKSQKS